MLEDGQEGKEKENEKDVEERERERCLRLEKNVKTEMKCMEPGSRHKEQWWDIVSRINFLSSCLS